MSSNSKHHSKPMMNINSQHHNLLGNQISPKSEDFFIWQPFCTLVTMAMATILNFFQPPKAATYYGGYSYKMDHNTAPKPWISIPNIKIYLETKFRPKWRIFVFWRPNGHHSKPTMDINSQHHNLLGNQISPKSEVFCILVAILYLGYHGNSCHFEFFNPPKSCHPLRWIFLQSF